MGVVGKKRGKTSRGKKAGLGVPWSGCGCENERVTRYLPATGGPSRDFRPVGVDSRRCSRYPGAPVRWYRPAYWRSRLAYGFRGADVGAKTSGSVPYRNGGAHASLSVWVWIQGGVTGTRARW